MARIRTIKPEFFSSEQITSVSMAARVFFIGLWTHADREGRFQWAPRKLKAQIFPYADDPNSPNHSVEIYPLAEELTVAGLLHIYEVDKQAYGWIPGFTKHQRPHPKEAQSTIPPCPEAHDPTTLPWNRETKPGKDTASTGTIPSSRGGREGKEILDKGKEVPSEPAPAVPDWPKPPREPARQHANHVFPFCEWVCLPEFLFGQFAARCPGGDDEVQAWAKGVRAAWQGRTVTEDELTFWRKRWRERTPDDDEGAMLERRSRRALEAIREQQERTAS